MMRILVIMTSPFCCDGISQMLCQINDGCQSEACKMEYLLAEGEENVSLRNRGVKIYDLPRRKASLLKYLRALQLLLKQEHFDAVHIHANSAMVAFEAVTAKLCGVKKILVHSHNSSTAHPMMHRLCRPFLNWAVTDPIACSDIAGKWLFTKPFRILHNGIDTQKFRFSSGARTRTREALGLNGCFVVGHIGRFTPQKNQLFLLEIFHAFLQRNANARLLMLGGGELSGALHDRVEQLGLTNAVIFAGEVDDPQNYYPAMDCFLLPSLFEGLPLVLIEAQAEGLNCFVSDQVSRQADITGLVHFLSLQATPAQWAECMTIPGNRPDMTAAIRKARYDISDTARTLLSIYKGTQL